jgi:hypothetical protein
MENNYLYEDPVIPSQQYCLVSYVIPKELEELMENKSIAIKFRGAFNPDKLNKKVEELKRKDKSKINIYSLEVGKWTELATKKTIEKWEEENLTDVVHSDRRLTELLEKREEEIEKGKQLFEERKKELQEKGKKSEIKEDNPVLIKDRIEFNTGRVKELKKELDEVKRVLREDKLRIKEFSKEEVDKCVDDLKKKNTEYFSLD